MGGSSPRMTQCAALLHCLQVAAFDRAFRRQGDGGAGALADLAFQREVAAMQAREAARERQAHADAFEAPVEVGLDLRERLHYALEVLRRDPDAVVFDG